MESYGVTTDTSIKKVDYKNVQPKSENSDADKSNVVVGEKKSVVSREGLDASVKKANNVLFKNNTHLQFRVHEKTKDIMVKIINDETGEVLKEIPPEKMLDMVAKIWEIAGILIDERR